MSVRYRFVTPDLILRAGCCVTLEAYNGAAASGMSPWWIECSETLGIDQVLDLAAPSARHLVQLAPGRLVMRLIRLEGPGLGIHGGTAHLPLRAVGVTPPRGSVTVSFLLEAPGCCTMHGRDVQPGDVILWPAGLSYDGVAPAGHRWATAILPDRAARDLGWMDGVEGEEVQIASLTSARLSGARKLLDEMLAWRDAEITDLEPSVYEPLRDRCYDILSHVFQRSRPARQPERAVGSALRVVRAVEDLWLLQLDRRARLDEAADAARVSPRSVESAFRRILGMPPFRYLELLRAHALFLELRRTDADAPATVKEAERRCGVAHPSRFASRYRSIFGELPSETLHRTGAEPDR